MSERDVNSEAITHWLIRHAARSAPASLSERLEEEWRADLVARPSAMSRLRFALGCCWATRVIAYEHRPASAPVVTSAMGEKLMIAYAHNDSRFFARRSITFLLVVGLHIALFYALMTSLSFNIIKVIPTTLQTRFLPAPQPRALPPLPPPQLTTARNIEAPVPEFPPTGDLNENEGVVAEPPGTAPPMPQTPPAIPLHEVNRVLGGPGSGFPHPDDYYPSVAKFKEEQGVATVRVCVGANGRLTSDPMTVQTSGSPRLDEGALQLAKAGSGHYRATTEDGRPVNSCYSFRVRFELK
jgi:periplasmic protein TonB